nr:hypothetical protein [Anaerolineae bacterium]
MQSEDFDLTGKMNLLLQRIESHDFGELDAFETAQLVARYQRIHRKLMKLTLDIEQLLELSE